MKSKEAIQARIDYFEKSVKDIEDQLKGKMTDETRKAFQRTMYEYEVVLINLKWCLKDE